jgi:uncharacterized protein (TIGR02678 family)
MREQSEQLEVREAVRWLLATPLVLASQDPERFAFVRRYQDSLTAWFLQWLNYRLVVDRDFARLHKVALPVADASRPARRRSRVAFDRERYVLLTLVLAIVESGSQQVSLSSLARAVHEAAQLERLPAPTFERRGERQAFVDVVRFLVAHGVLRFIDGDEDGYLGGSNDALYDVDQRAAANLLSTGFMPGAGPDDPGGDAGVYAESSDGATLRLRHRCMRMLCENSVVYYEDLTGDERSYITAARPTLRRELRAMVGLGLEVRSDGIAGIDESGGLSDIEFPGQSSVAHAALLLALEMARAARDDEHRSRVFTHGELHRVMVDLVRRYGRFWKHQYTTDDSTVWELLDHAVALLANLGMVRRDAGGVQVRPMINRFRIAARNGDEAPV